MADVYIDAQAGSDSTGDGSVGSPYQTIQYALTNHTADSNGNSLILAGTFTQTASLSFGNFTPSSTKPLWWIGSNRPTINTYSGGFFTSSPSYVVADGIDFNVHHAGVGLGLASYCRVEHCNFYGNSTSGGQAVTFSSSSYSSIQNCTFDGFTPGGSDAVIFGGTSLNAINNVATNCEDTFIRASHYSYAAFNYVELSSGYACVWFRGHSCQAEKNVFYGQDSTGTGVLIDSSERAAVIRGNYFEGLNIGVDGNNVRLAAFDDNRFYNCVSNTVDITYPSVNVTSESNSLLQGKNIGPASIQHASGLISGRPVLQPTPNTMKTSGAM